MRLLRHLTWATLALALAAGFAMLGFWQAGRGVEKQRWLEGHAAALASPARALAPVLAEPPSPLPVRVEGTLRLRPAPLLLLDNQQREGRVGVRAYALGDVEGATRPLLVELGWLPLGPERVLPQVAVPQMPQTIAGMLLAWPGQGIRAAPNPWNGEVVLLTYIDRDEISRAAAADLYPGLLQPDPALPLGYLRDAGSLPNTLPPERHRGYAVQWWGLSITVIIIYLILAWRRSVA